MLFKKNKKGENTSPLMIGVLILFALVLLNQLNIFTIPGTGVGEDGVATQRIEVEVTGDTCTVDQTTYNTKSVNKYKAATSFSDGNAYSRLFITNGAVRGDQGLFADGASKALSPGDTITIYAGENSSTRFVQKIEKEVPCSGTLDIIANLAPVDVAPTFTWFNEDGDTNTLQDIGADDIVNFEVKLKATADAAVGNPYLLEQCKSGTKEACNVWCYEFNRTAIDKVSMKDGVINGVDAFTPQAVAVPRDIANNLSGVLFAFDCWTFPQIEDGGNFVATLEIDTASSAPGASNSINTSIAYADYGLHSDTNAELVGVEDNNFNTLVAGTPIFLSGNPIEAD